MSVVDDAAQARAMTGALRTPADVAAAVQLACLLEASAPKPGNVSPGRPFEDLRYEDFVASAVAIRPAFEGIAARPLGETIRLAIEATMQWTSTNTNLGIVLLVAPLARAAATEIPTTETTVDDAREVYRAIRLASPGGLGHAESQDVADEPTMTLLEVMRLAADRDSIASEYATGFALTRTVGAPAIETARRDGLSWDDAIVEAFLTLLATKPDTHIVRRAGADSAAFASQLARTALEAGGVRSASGRRAIDDMDVALRDARHRMNPGTTADLTAAAILVALLNGGWERRSA